jgi:hypothetical protein
MSVRYNDNSDLVIHHAYEVGMDDLVRLCISRSHGSPMLYWADGIAFFYEQIPPMMNAKVEEDFLAGKDHWAEVYYSKVKEYKSVIELDNGEFRGAKIGVVDASKFSMHKDFAKWAGSR